MRLKGIAYRAHNPRWSWSPLSGEGARLFGGRFNPKGVSALYLSLDVTTAINEASQGFGARFPPLTLVSYEVDCDDIVDLSSTEGRDSAGVAYSDLACPWLLMAESRKPVPSRAIAERLMGERAAGIIVPSFAVGARSEDKNLVLWDWGPDLPHRIVVFGPDMRLPKDDQSWT